MEVLKTSHSHVGVIFLIDLITILSWRMLTLSTMWPLSEFHLPDSHEVCIGKTSVPTEWRKDSIRHMLSNSLVQKWVPPSAEKTDIFC